MAKVKEGDIKKETPGPKKKVKKDKTAEKAPKKEVKKKNIAKDKDSAKKEKDTKKKDKSTKASKDKGPKKPKPEKTPKVKPEPTPSLFSKIGQKHITPPKGDGTRGFYESLIEANPCSVIATAYCVENGLFGGQDHQELYQRYIQLKQEGLLKGPAGAIRPQAVKFLSQLDTKKTGKKTGK